MILCYFNFTKFSYIATCLYAFEWNLDFCMFRVQVRACIRSHHLHSPVMVHIDIQGGFALAHKPNCRYNLSSVFFTVFPLVACWYVLILRNIWTKLNRKMLGTLSNTVYNCFVNRFISPRHSLRNDQLDKEGHINWTFKYILKSY